MKYAYSPRAIRGALYPPVTPLWKQVGYELARLAACGLLVVSAFLWSMALS